ncbi:MAG TPA: DUF547 domain-containing protein [Saprospiraceae bacterium]|nr:DUF547 domain-containing protein [Saprospiraceae bacterium]
MKNLKFILFFALVISLSACGDSGNSSASSDTKTPEKIAIDESPNTTNTSNENSPTSTSSDVEKSEQTDSQTKEQEATKLTKKDAPSTTKEKVKKLEEKVKTATPKLTEKKTELETKIQKEVINNNTTTTTPIEKKVEKTVETKKDNIIPAKTKIKEEVKKDTPKKPAFSHSSWDALLKKNVTSSGKVNYKGFKADLPKLRAYLKLLAKNPVQADWSKNKKMAYWINAYNAYTVKLILDNYPTASITKLEGGKPWDKKWIKLNGKTYSLNNIENDILRPQFKDARIHFAVNCAAKSCPPILNRAWTVNNLNSNFEKRAKQFINDTKYNQIAADKIKVSKIFEWYASDFGNLINFLNKYSNTKINSDAKVEYLDYNWNLNE